MGEFLDHWFDSFNMVLVMAAMLLVLELPAWLVVALVSIGALAFLCQFWEQRLTGWLLLGRFGTIEGQLIAVGFYLLLSVTGVQWLAAPLSPGGPSLALLITLAVIAGGALTPAAILWRVRRPLGPLVPLVVVLGLNLLWFALAPVPPLLSVVIVLLSNGFISGRMIISRITHSPYFGLDGLLILMLAAGAAGAWLGWSPALNLSWSLGVIAYLAVRVTLDFVFTLLRLDGYLQDREVLSGFVAISRALGFAASTEHADES